MGVKTSLSIIVFFPEYGFPLPRVLSYQEKIVDSVLYGKIRVRTNPYSGRFYAVDEGSFSYDALQADIFT